MKKLFSFLVIIGFTGITHANLFVNPSFSMWSTKTVQPAAGSAVTLSYPAGWSFEPNGDADGVTKWGNTIFTQTSYTYNDCGVIEIKGYSTPFKQLIYQEFNLDAGLYSFSALFKGGGMTAGTNVTMVIKSADGNTVLSSESLSRMPAFGSSVYTPYTQSVYISSGGTYRVGFLAENTNSQCWIQVVNPIFAKIDLTKSNRLENSDFVSWETKTVQSTNSGAVSLSYPAGWSFESNGDGDGVTKWGNTIFTRNSSTTNGSKAIEIKGYSTAYNQTIYQDVSLDAGSYLFSGVFRGGAISATSHICMIIKNTATDEVIYNNDVSSLPGYNDTSFTNCTGTITISTSGTYRVGVKATNTNAEYWVQVADLFLKKNKEGECISRVVNENGRNYLEYKGAPQLLYGIEARIDDYLGSYNPYGNAAKLKTIYQYFQKSQNAGFRDIAIPVPWYWIERGDGNFDFSLVDTLVTNAERYHQKIQLVWFGSNVCGWSSVPDYIKNDATLYPKLPVAGSPLDLSNINLINRELRAFCRLLDYLSLRDTHHLVYMIQVENEPDHKGGTNELWAGGQKTAALRMINLLGQLVHNSSLDMVTRVNFTGWTTAANEMKDYPGVDIIGRDTYTDPLQSFLSASNYFNYSWNINHTPENGAQYKNVINLALSAFERGNGYLHYELRTTDWRTSEYDLGMYRSTTGNEWIERDGTQQVPYSLTKTNPGIEVDMREVKDFHEMIYKADKQIAASPASRNAAFNLANAAGNVYETKSFGDYTVTYTSPVGGEAFAMQLEDESLVLMSLKNNSSFTFGYLPETATLSVGYYTNENEWVETSTRAIQNKTVTLNAKEVARVRTQTGAHLMALQVNEFSNSTPVVNLYCSGTTLVIRSVVSITYVQIYTGTGALLFSKQINDDRASVDVADLKGQLLFVRTTDEQGNIYGAKIQL